MHAEPLNPPDSGLPATGPSAARVQEQLKKVLEAPQFQKTATLKALLNYVVAGYLADDQEGLKESAILLGVFHRSPGVADRSTVRTAANRLRAKLQSYYQNEGRFDEVIIEIPAGHYVPSLKERGHSFSQVPLLPDDPAVIVGRESELKFLSDEFKCADHGTGRMVAVVAEPGVGKTTLVDTFLQGLVRSGVVAAKGFCRQELERSEPFLPWREAFEALTRWSPQAVTLLQTLAPSWWARIRGTIPNPSSEPPALKREAQRFLEALSSSAPVVLFLDDLHWADAATVDLLAYLNPVLRSMRVFLITTYRPSDLRLYSGSFRQVEPELKISGLLSDLVLSELGSADVIEFLGRRFPRHAFSREVGEWFLERSGGNPLCLVNLCDYAVRRQWIVATGKGWSTIEPAAWDSGLPNSVQGMVSKKLAEVGASDLRLLGAAAIQGTEFDSFVVAAAAGSDPVSIEDSFQNLAETHRILRPLRDRDTLLRGRTQVYGFTHVLYREGILNLLGPALRTKLSLTVADSMIAAYGEGALLPFAAHLGRLLEDGGVLERALPFYQRACMQAVHASAYLQAFQLARHASDLIGGLPRNEVLARTELGLLTVQGLASGSLIGYHARELERIHHRVREICGELHDDTAGIAVEQMHWASVSLGDLRRGMNIAESLHRRATTANEPMALVLSSMSKGVTHLQRGEVEAARSTLFDGVETWRAHQDRVSPRNFIVHPAVALLCNLSRAFWFAGYPESSLRSITEAIDIGALIQHNRTLAYSLAIRANIAHFNGDAKEALRWAKRAADLAREQDLPYELAWAELVSAWAIGESGDPEAAARLYSNLLQHYRGPCLPKFLCHHASMLLKVGGLKEAEEVLSAAFRVASERDENYFLSEMQRLQGELILRRKSPTRSSIAQGDRLIRQAISTAGQQRAKSCELRAVAHRLRFCEEFSPSEVSAARTALSALLASMPEPSDAPDRKSAQMLLDA